MPIKFKSFPALILYVIFTLSTSCKNDTTNDPVAYFHYVIDKKNGLFQEKIAGNYAYSIQYKPSTYMALTDNENFPLSSESLVQQESEYEARQYYTFRIKVASDTEHLDILTYNLSSEKEYNDRVRYIETEIQNDICLVCDNDTSIVSSFLYEKSSDLNDYTSFLISFPSTSNNEADRKFIFRDKKFKSGVIIFTIKASDIANALKYNP